MSGKNSKDDPSIAVNRAAYHDYFVEESYEAGVSLAGTEVKSIRAGHVNLRGAYAKIRNNELWIEGMNISRYDEGTYMNHEPLRPRKLLMRRKQITALEFHAQTKGYTLIPLRMYFKGNLVKIELGLCKGKKLYDKREDMAKRDSERELARINRRG